MFKSQKCARGRICFTHVYLFLAGLVKILLEVEVPGVEFANPLKKKLFPNFYSNLFILTANGSFTNGEGELRFSFNGKY